MAIVDKKGLLHGKVGPVVYLVRREKQILKAKPGLVNQTAATKESALEFGLASNSALVIRDAFAGTCFMSDLGMINRLNGAVLRCLKGSMHKERGERDLHDGDLNQLKGFQFNTNSPLDQVLSVRPECVIDSDKRIQVRVPAFRTDTELKHRQNSTKCTMRLMLMVLNYREQYYECLEYTDLDLDQYNTPKAFDWAPKVQIPAGCIAFVSLSIQYFGYSALDKTHIFLNSKEFNPAEIIGAFSIAADEATPATVKQTSGKRMNGYLGVAILAKFGDIRKKGKRHERKAPEKIPDKPADPLGVPKGRVKF